MLSKLPPGKEVGSGDHFRYNDAYSSRLYRVKINTVQLRETPEENKKTNDQVLQDRQYQIDAAVVRIMKTRKTLSHKLLVAELMAQLKFPVSAVSGRAPAQDSPARWRHGLGKARGGLA